MKRIQLQKQTTSAIVEPYTLQKNLQARNKK